MSRQLRTALQGVGAVAVLALLVAGCADGGSSGGASKPPADPSPTESSEPPTEPAPAPTGLEPGESVKGLPEGVEGTMDSPAGVGWSPVDGRLYVVTFGSSSCPRLAEAGADWDDGHESVVVRLVDPPADTICTMDYMPTTSVVAVPDDVDASAPLSVRLAGEGVVEVAPRPAPGEPGPMAWLSAD